jgi:hypothetical protein
MGGSPPTPVGWVSTRSARRCTSLARSAAGRRKAQPKEEQRLGLAFGPEVPWLDPSTG